TRGVRNLIGSRRGLLLVSVVGLCDRLRLAGNVAWADDHWKRELIDAVFIRKRLDIADHYFDRGPRQAVGDRLGEEGRALLIEERGDAALRTRLREESLRFRAPFDFAANHLPADIHRQLINGGTRRQREEVDGFDLLFHRVMKLLRQGDARKKAADFGL